MEIRKKSDYSSPSPYSALLVGLGNDFGLRKLGNELSEMAYFRYPTRG